MDERLSEVSGMLFDYARNERIKHSELMINLLNYMHRMIEVEQENREQEIEVAESFQIFGANQRESEAARMALKYIEKSIELENERNREE